jgi:integrase
MTATTTTKKPRALTDAWLRTLKYKQQPSKGEKGQGQLLGNRYSDQQAPGMYVFVSPGGGISFRHDFKDPTPPHSRQCVVYGRYFTGEGSSAIRLSTIGMMLNTIHCSTDEQREALGTASSSIMKAVGVFQRAMKAAPLRHGKAIPLLTLEEARDTHREFRRQLSLGVNPLDTPPPGEQAAAKAAENALPADFRSVGERWFAANKVTKSGEKSASWQRMNRRYLEMAYPIIGARPVHEITVKEISALIKPIENSGRAVTSDKLRMCLAMVFDHAIAKDFLMGERPNPARALSVDLPDAKHFTHLDIREVPEFLSKVDKDTGTEQARIAVRLLFLCLTRKMELLGAKWGELDLDAARWLIPARRMKARKDHLVPLSRQAIALFRRLKELSNGSDFVFPHRDRPADHHMGPGTLRSLYDRVGYTGRVTSHGARSTASSALNEMGHYRPEVIERQLSHVEDDETRAAYMHSDFMRERRTMLQEWGDALDRICAGQPLNVEADNVLQLKPRAA